MSVSIWDKSFDKDSPVWQKFSCTKILSSVLSCTKVSGDILRQDARSKCRCRGSLLCPFLIFVIIVIAITLRILQMSFHGGVEETILFKDWRIDNAQGMVGSAIGVILLTALYEGLKAYRWVNIYQNG